MAPILRFQILKKAKYVYSESKSSLSFFISTFFLLLCNSSNMGSGNTSSACK
jgi:hypothetical protein